MNKEQFKQFKPYIFLGASITFYGHYYDKFNSYFNLFCSLLCFIIGVLLIAKNNNEFFKKTKSKLILADPIITIICGYITLCLPLSYNIHFIIATVILVISSMYLSNLKFKKLNHIE